MTLRTLTDGLADQRSEYLSYWLKFYNVLSKNIYNV